MDARNLNLCWLRVNCIYMFWLWLSWADSVARGLGLPYTSQGLEHLVLRCFIRVLGEWIKVALVVGRRPRVPAMWTSPRSCFPQSRWLRAKHQPKWHWCRSLKVQRMGGGGLVAKSCPTLVTPWTHARLFCPWDFPGKKTGVGCHFLLQGIFPTHDSNPGLLHCRQIPYWLSYEGSPG